MLHVKFGFMASEEMSFENVDDGRMMGTCLYYKLTAQVSYKKTLMQSIKYAAKIVFI